MTSKQGNDYWIWRESFLFLFKFVSDENIPNQILSSGDEIEILKNNDLNIQNIYVIEMNQFRSSPKSILSKKETEILQSVTSGIPFEERRSLVLGIFCLFKV